MHFLNQIKSNKKYLTLVACLVVGIFIAGWVGYSIGLYVQKDRYSSFLKSFRNIRENSDKYTFINPLIGGLSAPATTVGIYSDIKSDIKSYLQEEMGNGTLYGYSFYFRDLGTGLWFGTNENADFAPASLFKLPVAIAIYKQAEDDHSFLKKQVVYTADIAQKNSAIQSNSESTLTVGGVYSVENLVEIMLVQSDNGAKNLLLSVMDTSYLNDIFSVATLVSPSSTKTYEISSRKYSLFLRMLYGSSYINEEHSEHILSLLSKSTFKDGLVAGVPEQVPVAHKFGTYQFEETINGKQVDTQQLHDCGIVYHAKKPYVFCLMTKGSDVPGLYRVISTVSRLVYEYQDKAE